MSVGRCNIQEQYNRKKQFIKIYNDLSNLFIQHSRTVI